MSEDKPIPLGNFLLSGSIPKLTRLAYNTSVRSSLKVTIPMEIVKRLKLKKGDDVVWFIGQEQEGPLIALLYNKEDYQKAHNADAEIKKYNSLMLKKWNVTREKRRRV